MDPDFAEVLPEAQFHLPTHICFDHSARRVHYVMHDRRRFSKVSSTTTYSTLYHWILDDCRLLFPQIAWRHSHHLLRRPIDFLLEFVAGLADGQFLLQRLAKQLLGLAPFTFSAQAGRSTTSALPLKDHCRGRCARC